MPYKDKEAQREYQRRWVAHRRSSWILSMGGCCKECGSKEDLEIDHIDQHTKEMEPRDIWSKRRETRDKELAKCQVLCTICHRKKSDKELSVETMHGTWSGYERDKCRCNQCKAWKSKKNKK